MELKERILACATVCGVSSKEQSVAHKLMEELSAMGISSYFDASGNLHSEILGNPQGKTILLEAHMDQIGLMVSGIDENGFLKFVGVGGIDERMLCGLEVLVDGRYSGVIVPAKKEEKVPKIEDLRMWVFPVKKQRRKSRLVQRLLCGRVPNSCWGIKFPVPLWITGRELLRSLTA